MMEAAVTNRRWHIAVLIPACNEENLLPRCLDSVKSACSFVSDWASVDIVLAVDQSTDLTREIGEQILSANGNNHGVVIAAEAGVVGRTRALAAQAALARYRGPLDRCWLANTDADSHVPVTWLRDQLDLARRGAQAIAGTIDVDDFTEHASFVEERFRRSYHIFADGTHPHVHGANFGVRADMYVEAGGWGNIPTAEDHDLWNRLGKLGARRVSVNHIRVITSGRRIGRAPQGFAGALAAHNLAFT